jgi:hypothetical protein
MEISSTDFGHFGILSFPHCGSCLITLQPVLAYASHAIALVAIRGCHMIVTTKIRFKQNG